MLQLHVRRLVVELGQSAAIVLVQRLTRSMVLRSFPHYDYIIFGLVLSRTSVERVTYLKKS